MAKTIAELQKIITKEMAEAESRAETRTEAITTALTALDSRMASLIQLAINEAKKILFEEVKTAVVLALNKSLKGQVLTIVNPISEKLDAANLRIASLESHLSKANDRQETERR